jgi:hypothetical protein
MHNVLKEIMTTNINIRKASENDFDEIWPTFQEIVISSETYAYDRQITKEAAFEQWMVYPRMTFVVEMMAKF